jgi:hypothetical protein
MSNLPLNIVNFLNVFSKLESSFTIKKNYQLIEEIVKKKHPELTQSELALVLDDDGTFLSEKSSIVYVKSTLFEIIGAREYKVGTESFRKSISSTGISYESNWSNYISAIPRENVKYLDLEASYYLLIHPTRILCAFYIEVIHDIAKGFDNCLEVILLNRQMHEIDSRYDVLKDCTKIHAIFSKANGALMAYTAYFNDEIVEEFLVTHLVLQ